MADQRCRSCGAEIVWVNMQKTGKANPLDALPSPKGNVLIMEGGIGVVLSRAEIEANPRNDLRLSHFASCPHSSQHRKK